MDSSTAWALVVGALTPVLVAAVNQPRWTRQTRQVVAVVVAVLVGLVTVIVQGAADFSAEGAVITIAAVVGAAQAAYAVLWRPTGVAPAVMRATSPGPVRYAEQDGPDRGGDAL